MTRKQKDNSGVLFRYHKKKTANQPDYTGSCLIDGFEYWQSAWLKTSESGEKFMSFAYTRKDKKGVQQKIDGPNNV